MWEPSEQLIRLVTIVMLVLAITGMVATGRLDAADAITSLTAIAGYVLGYSAGRYDGKGKGTPNGH